MKMYSDIEKIKADLADKKITKEEALKKLLLLKKNEKKLKILRKKLIDWVNVGVYTEAEAMEYWRNNGGYDILDIIPNQK